MLANDLLQTLDPARFARDELGFEPDPWQARVLRSSDGRLLLNCSRQTGKSTTAAALALHRAYFQAGSLVLLVSPSQRQSSELFRKVSDFIDAMRKPPELPEDNKLSCTLANGSRIVSLPGSESTIRGFSGASLIIEDEAARCPDSLYRAVRPMLATSGGRLILMSTPFGRRGHFFEAWQAGEDWTRVELKGADCPRISAEFLAEERRSLPASWYRQEYECSFEDVEGAIFSYEVVMGALVDEAPFLEDAEYEQSGEAVSDWL